MHSCHMLIKRGQLDIFHGILCATKGYYLNVPQIRSDSVYVHFAFGDAAAFEDAWKHCTTPIVEKRSDQLWRKWLRRLKFWI